MVEGPLRQNRRRALIILGSALLTCFYFSLLKQQHNATSHKSTTCIQNLTLGISNIDCSWYQLHFCAPNFIWECLILTRLLLLPKSHSPVPRCCWYSPLQLWLSRLSQQLKTASPITQLRPLDPCCSPVEQWSRQFWDVELFDPNPDFGWRPLIFRWHPWPPWLWYGNVSVV